MTASSEMDALLQVVNDYLEGMIWGDAARLHRAFHPKATISGHFGGAYENSLRDDFIAAILPDAVPAGTPFTWEIVSVDITGDVAVIKLTDSCFGADFTDYLMLIKDAGAWQIVSKAYCVHPNSIA